MEKIKHVNTSKTLPEKNTKELTKILKNYINFFKILHHVDPVIASEFQKKQEHFFYKSHKHIDDSNHGGNNSHVKTCCSHKLNNRIYVPVENMNNIEKNLREISESFFYQANLDDMLNYLNEKYENIKISALKKGMCLDSSTERDFLHRFLVEGVTFYYVNRLKEKLKKFEESISEQPMLLAHPSSVESRYKELLEKINAKYISELVKEDYCLMNFKIYEEINEYELFNEFRYIYLENHFEDSSLLSGSKVTRTDFLLRFNYNYFKTSKFKTINTFANVARYLPYELNRHFPDFSLQTNDYLQASYFLEDYSFIDRTIDSSFEEGYDTGKKITAMFILFPNELELQRRKITVKIKRICDKNHSGPDRTNNAAETEEVLITQPLSLVLFKSRVISYQIEKQNFPFLVIFYYMHGPVDKKAFRF